MNAEEKYKRKVITAASSFLSEQPEGDLYDAYEKLCEANDAGAGRDLAMNYVVVWQPLEELTVNEIIEIIDDAIDGLEPEHPDFMVGIDWALLREQKKALLEVIEDYDKNYPESATVTKTRLAGLEGILALLDNLQDYAVDVMGVKESDVFEFEPEEE